MTQGDRLRALAKAAGFSSLAGLARAAGIPEGTARQHANRNSIPTDAAERYIGVARGTGATLDWLLSNRGDPPKPASSRKEAEPSYSPWSASFELPAQEAFRIVDRMQNLSGKLKAAKRGAGLGNILTHDEAVELEKICAQLIESIDLSMKKKPDRQRQKHDKSAAPDLGQHLAVLLAEVVAHLERVNKK